MIGIIEEQHPDRARLFMQWKEMSWPILVDSLNLLGVSAVPVTMLIDEHGTIREVQPKEDDLERFLGTSYPAPASSEGDGGASGTLLARADHAYLWGDEVGRTIDLYQQVLEKDPENGPVHFRLGTAFRRRYDSPERREGDFRKAVEHWFRALASDPNQYIWRRRIQQYGPRLDKPYPFYDWVDKARQDITARGETPVPLAVEPGGAEFAQPRQSFPATTPSGEPDPGGRILRDEAGLIDTETTVVPPAVSPGETVRVHVVFRPDRTLKAHWNNEVDDLVFWVSSPDDWDVDDPRLRVEVPPQPVSQETRSVEFELRSPDDFTGSVTIPCYALYYICEDVNGVCLYRRQDVPVTIRSRP